jgi:hypothetical protein
LATDLSGPLHIYSAPCEFCGRSIVQLGALRGAYERGLGGETKLQVKRNFFRPDNIKNSAMSQPFELEFLNNLWGLETE